MTDPLFGKLAFTHYRVNAKYTRMYFSDSSLTEQQGGTRVALELARRMIRGRKKPEVNDATGCENL